MKAKLALEKASKVAGILAEETPASRPVLRGLIQETAGGQAEETCREILERESVSTPSRKDQALSAQERKLQSLEAKIANAEKKLNNMSKKPKAAKQRDALPPQKNQDPKQLPPPPTKRANPTKNLPTRRIRIQATQQKQAKTTTLLQKAPLENKKRNAKSKAVGKKENSKKPSCN